MAQAGVALLPKKKGSRPAAQFPAFVPIYPAGQGSLPVSALSSPEPSEPAPVLPKFTPGENARG